MIEYAAHDAHYLIFITQEMFKESFTNNEIENAIY